jgi:hypothetical protein
MSAVHCFSSKKNVLWAPEIPIRLPGVYIENPLSSHLNPFGGHCYESEHKSFDSTGGFQVIEDGGYLFDEMIIEIFSHGCQ